jgi:hypothetical protein
MQEGERISRPGHLICGREKAAVYSETTNALLDSSARERGTRIQAGRVFRRPGHKFDNFDPFNFFNFDSSDRLAVLS